MNNAGYPITRFAEYCGATHADIKFQTQIKHLVTDTRNYRHTAESVFFAIVGDIHDGHDFLGDIYRAGMRNFVISDRSKASLLPEANVLIVDDARAALQSLAAEHRRRFRYPVVAITGSNGKTVVKEWLFQLLQDDYHIVRSPKSFNSQLGVPLAVWAMNDMHDLAIFEAGISHPGEMENLQRILNPDIGIFTNIGPPHQENFPDLATKVAEKMKLFRDASILVYCRDHLPIAEEVNKSFRGKQLTWSFQTDADLRITSTSRSPEGIHLKGNFRGQPVETDIPFTDAASLENVCHCWALMLELTPHPQNTNRRIANLVPVAMRLEQLEGLNGCTVINDTYNSDINSLEIALDFLRRQGKNSDKVAIVSDIAQSGEDPRALYSKVADMIRIKGIGRFVGIGPDISSHREVFEGVSAMFYPNTDSFLADEPLSRFSREDILVKGSRVFAFERIVDVLQRKSHETVLEIDLVKVIDNLNRIRALLPPGVKIMAVVKAFAYGSGTHELARLLEYNRVDYLAVAYIDEGVALREAGITLPILVLNPENSGYAVMISHRLEPLIYGFRVLTLFRQALARRNVEGAYPVHLKIDSGMHRLGFDPDEMDALGEALAGDASLEVKTVFSHLAGSERPDFDDVTNAQLRTFEKATDALAKHLDAPFMRHILNSAGVMRHPGGLFEMVRVGLALHGLSGGRALRERLEPAASLRTVISQIRAVKAGDRIGYAPGQAPAVDSRIAVLPIGYADGLRRALGYGKGRVYVGGKFAPFIGGICMDMAMVDVTGIPCEEGDPVEIFGEHVTVYELAEAMDTIPYEVLTGISPRVKRVFLTE